MVKIKGTAQIKIYDPNKPGSERIIETSNYVTERMYRLLYSSSLSGYTNLPVSQGHLNVFIASRTGYVIDKTGFDLRFLNSGVISPGLIGFGVRPTAQTSPIAYTSSELSVPFVQFFNRIDPPAVARTFNIIGLCAEGVGSTTAFPLTILQVDPPCNQNVNEFIDVIYNLEVVRGSSYFFVDDFCWDWVNHYVNSNSAGFSLHDIRSSYCELPALPSQTNGYRYLNVNRMSRLSDYFQGQLAIYNSPIKNQGWVDLNPGQLADVNTNHIGFVINTLFLGNCSKQSGVSVYPYYWERNPSIGTSPFQSKFNKKVDAIRPFWEPTDTPNSTGDVVFGGTWNPLTRFPEVVRIQIVSGGSVGTATYRVQIKKFVRLCAQNENTPVNESLGNTWSMIKGDTVPFINPAYPHPKHHGTGVTNPKAAWKDERVLMYDMNGVTLLNLYDGTFQSWDSSSTPSLSATAICQCEPIPSLNLIYVACRNTGLYLINTTANTVAKLNNDPCYGVCLGGSGKVYAVFNGRISNSDNWTTPLSLVSAGITTGNTADGATPAWNRVRYIKASPWDTTDKLAIIIDRTSGNNRFGNGNTTIGYVVWWSPTLGSTPCNIFTNSAGQDVTSNPNAVGCHPSLDSWIVPANCLVKWGETTPIVSNVAMLHTNYSQNNYAPPSVTGATPLMSNVLGWEAWFGTIPSNANITISIYYAAFYDGLAVSRVNLINPITGAVAMTKSISFLEDVGWDQGGSCIQVRGDLFLYWGPSLQGHYQLANLFRTHATNNALTQGWINYGWNGSSWVEGNTTPRITHTGASPLPNGTTVRFADGANTAPSFLDGQYVLQYMCHGILVDNTISWYYELNRYYSDFVVQSFPVGFTVPAAPNASNQYEVTLPKYKKVPQSNVYGWLDDGTTSGIDPDPEFYTADMQSKRSFSIALGGVVIPHTSIFYWTEKANPGPMEVSVEYNNNGNLRTDRRLRFHASDAGKSITGTYVYIKCPT